MNQPIVTNNFDDLRREYYGTILIDIAQRFASYDKKTVVAARATDNKEERIHYHTLSNEEVRALPVGDIAAADCVMHYWTSGPYLKLAIANLEHWGFEFKTIGFAWTKIDLNAPKPKPAFGMGYWTRANLELTLLATRGKPMRLDAGVPQAVLEPRREHSRKPEIYDRIERLSAGPYCELFARTQREGWCAWGDEIGKFPASKDDPQ